jgi:myo-inositol-1(or 4)-monophosphatase
VGTEQTAVTTTQSLLSLAVEAVNRSAEIVRTSEPGTLTAKGDRDMASEVDLRIERETHEFLATSAPDIGFLGEENGHNGSRDRYWALDPVDGTANYVRDIPLCAVSLALVDHGHPVVGAIRLPFLGQLYTAEHGRGAYEDGRRLQVSATTALRDAIVAIGDYAVGSGADSKNRARLTLTRYLAEQAQRVRMLGTAAIDLAWVAAGKLDASLTLSNKPWDMAAGALLVQEAGGRVVDRDGTDYSASSAATIATTPALTTELLALLAHAEDRPAPAL